MNCEICQKQFTTPYSLTRHMKNIHGRDEKMQREPEDNSDLDGEEPQEESDTEVMEEDKTDPCPDLGLASLWEHLVQETMRNLNIKKVGSVSKRHKEFSLHLRNKLRKYMKMFAEMEDDKVYQDLLREKAYLKRKGYVLPGEAWRAAWKNRKELVAGAIKQALDNITDLECYSVDNSEASQESDEKSSETDE